MKRKNVIVVIATLSIAILMLIISETTHAQFNDIKHQKKYLNMIADIADRTCKDVSLKGRSSSTELSGDVKVKLNKLLAKFAGLNIGVAGKVNNTEYEGMLQSDLLNAAKNANDCKIDVTKFLVDRYPFNSKNSSTQLQNKKITATILPITKYRRDDLVKLAQKFGIDNFDLSLDDIILKDYYLIRMHFKNSSRPISEPLKFNLLTDTSNSKILSVKRKVLRPHNKVVEVIDSIPKANWIWPESGVKSSMFWDYTEKDERQIAGFNAYRSLIQNCGYGRVNKKLITASNWEITEEARSNMTPSYYKITSVNTIGQESIMSLDTPLVVQNFTPTTRSSFMLKRSDNDIQNPQSSIGSDILLNDQALKFRNSVDISFVNGLDSNADIEIYVLCKLLPDSEITPKISLIGATSVILIVNSKSISAKSNPVLFKTYKLKEELTPIVIRTYSTTESIYLAWQKPKSPDYAGVRIFRSPERRLGNLRNNPGEEIYNGIGSTTKISLEHPNRPAFIYQQAEPIIYENEIYIEPPSRPSPPPKPFQIPMAPPLPSPVTGLKLIYLDELESNYFEDIPLDNTKSFTYTIYSYDNNGNSGYPIFINASLSDPLEAVIQK
jgi:hypothetical protein